MKLTRRQLNNCLGILSLLLLTISMQQVNSNPISKNKIDCHPTEGATKDDCENLDCVWEPIGHDQQPRPQPLGQALPLDQALTAKMVGHLSSKSEIAEPWCYYPDNYDGYKVSDLGQNWAKLARQIPSGLPNDIQELMVEVEELSGAVLRLKIYDSAKARFEPELPVLQLDKIERLPKQFSFEIYASGLLKITRLSTGAVLFETNLEKLIFSDKFIQLNSKLNTPFVYGLGEHYDTFLKLADSYKAYSFYHTDSLPLPGGTRSYGSFPFYINLDSDNHELAHGVYLHNSNAMDIILQPDHSITFRPIGGILDFLIFSGPYPIDVIKQYQNLVGLPDLPPRWALGFHLCRYGYKSLERTKLIYQRTRDSRIPFDVQWNDIDNMDRHNDFTYDPEKFKGLPEFIDYLHDTSMHYMLLFDPGLSQEENYHPYQLGEQMDIFVKNATNQTLIGKVWNDSGRTVFPDFSDPKTIEYWSMLFKKFQEEIKFDGAWIDMNDISNFVWGSLDGCPRDYMEHTPYRPGGSDLQHKSLCLTARHKGGLEYNLHNLYAFYESIATFKALQDARPGKRPFIISRSTAPGQGHYGGHWSGDVPSTWDYLKWSIPSLIEHSMYGFVMMGSDICGFNGNTDPELCARWSTLGAFYTFSRNHNDDVSIDQDPVALGTIVVEANRNALSKKYSMLPYLYTLIHRAHMYGEPIIRAVPFEFIRDKQALGVEYQFMWGGGLMISPIVEQNSSEKTSYLPKGRWYETCVRPARNEFLIPNVINSLGEWHTTKHVLQDDIPIFYRGGFIFPIYPYVHQTIAETVRQPVGLEIALDDNNEAKGELYMDEGDNVDGKYNHLTMFFNEAGLTIALDRDEYQRSVTIGRVKIYGLNKAVDSIKYKNETIAFSDKEHVVITMYLDGTQVTKSQPLNIEILYK